MLCILWPHGIAQSCALQALMEWSFMGPMVRPKSPVDEQKLAFVKKLLQKSLKI